MTMSQTITTNLWFDDQAVEAAEFYVSVFGGDSRVVNIANYPENSPGEAGTPMVVEFELRGQRLIAINGGPAHYNFSEAVSLQVNCEDQAEVDYFWERLTADGGEEGPCGWCKDKYGLSWQVTPPGMDEFFAGDPRRAQAAFEAMRDMKKLDLAALHAAANSVPVGS